MSYPVAITGFGFLAPTGTEPEALWQALEGRADLRGPWPKRPLDDTYPVDGVVAVPEAVWAETAALAAHAEDSSAGRAAGIAEHMVGAALAGAGLEDPAAAAAVGRIGCFLATTTAGVEAAEADRVAPEAGAAPARRLDGSAIVPRRPGGWTGPTAVLSTACSSGLLAPALAIDALVAGEAEAMVAGGLDVLLEYTICGFNGLRLVAPDGCRPFAAGRRGAVLSEGGAAVCLEPLDTALARGAPIHAVITGYGMSCDAGHATAPDPTGIAKAVRGALVSAGAEPDAIGGIFAHATGTLANDAAEIQALRTAFGREALPPLTGVKSILGHAQAGAGSLTLVAAILALEHDRLPPTAGLAERDPELGAIDVVAEPGRRPAARTLMVDAFGFGGNNCVVTIAGPEAASGLLARAGEAASAGAAAGPMAGEG
ncbi:MAG: beta-ketoacyl synthase N-terminal-like domain-containing protein [Azospirillaceae bacterium]